MSMAKHSALSGQIQMVSFTSSHISSVSSVSCLKRSVGTGEQPLPGPCAGALTCSAVSNAHALTTRILCFCSGFTAKPLPNDTCKDILCRALSRQVCGQSRLVSFTGTSKLLILPRSDGTCNIFLDFLDCQIYYKMPVAECRLSPSMSSCSVYCMHTPSSTSGDKQCY